MKRVRLLAPFAAVAIALAPMSTVAAPAFYHWYHAYDEPMSTCSELLKEAARNVSADSGDVNRYNASVRLDGARGFMRCLSRGKGKSWVVIISVADRKDHAKELFERMRLVVCGECADF